MQQRIRLTESELHYIVEDSVRQYLIQEGFFSNVWNGAKNVAGGVWDATKAAGNTAGAMYYNGVANGQIQKLEQMKKNYETQIAQIEKQIQQLQQKAQGKQQAAQGNMQNLRNRMQPSTNYNQPQTTQPNTQPNMRPQS